MSADGTNACPACYSRATSIPFNEITQIGHLNNVIGLGLDDDSLREYFENYIDEGCVVFEYHGAECEVCGYSIPAFTLRQMIDGPEPA